MQIYFERCHFRRHKEKNNKHNKKQNLIPIKENCSIKFSVKTFSLVLENNFVSSEKETRLLLFVKK